MRRISIILGIVILAAVLLSPFATIRTTTVEVDSISGQVRKANVWTGGHRSTLVESSELADRLRSLGIGWTPEWQMINVTEYGVLGNAKSRACSLAPPIYQLRPVFAEFADASSADELRGFVNVMQNGSESEQRQAVDQAGNRGVNAALAVRPGR